MALMISDIGIISAFEAILGYRLEARILMEALSAPGSLSADGNRMLALVGDKQINVFLVEEGRLRGLFWGNLR